MNDEEISQKKDAPLFLRKLEQKGKKSLREEDYIKRPTFDAIRSALLKERQKKNAAWPFPSAWKKYPKNIVTMRALFRQPGKLTASLLPLSAVQIEQEKVEITLPNLSRAPRYTHEEITNQLLENGLRAKRNNSRGRCRKN